MSTITYTVTLESEAFGVATFEYDSWQDVLEGITSLQRGSEKAFKRDKIERRIVIHVGDAKSEPEPA